MIELYLFIHVFQLSICIQLPHSNLSMQKKSQTATLKFQKILVDHF